MPGVGYPGQFSPGVEYLLGAQNVTVCHHILSVGGAKVTRPPPNGDVLFQPAAVVAPTVFLVQDEQPVSVKRRPSFRPIDGDVFAPAPSITFGGIEVEQPRRQQFRKSFVEQPYVISLPVAPVVVPSGWTDDAPTITRKKRQRQPEAGDVFAPTAFAPITFGWHTADIPSLRKRKTLRPIEEPLPFLPPAVVFVQPFLAWDAELPRRIKRRPPRLDADSGNVFFISPAGIVFVVDRLIHPRARLISALFRTVRLQHPDERETSAVFETIRLQHPEARRHSGIVKGEREPVTTLDPIAPAETQRVTWDFRLTAGETISTKTVTAIANCTVVSSTIVGNTVQALIHPTVASGIWQVECRITTTPNARILDKTFQGPIQRYYANEGPKDPDDADDFSIDWEDLVGAETITDLTATMVAGNVVVGADQTAGTITTVRLTAGDVNTLAQVAHMATTNAGRVLEVVERFMVEAL